MSRCIAKKLLIQYEYAAQVQQTKGAARQPRTHLLESTRSAGTRLAYDASRHANSNPLLAAAGEYLHRPSVQGLPGALLASRPARQSWHGRPQKKQWRSHRARPTTRASVPNASATTRGGESRGKRISAARRNMSANSPAFFSPSTRSSAPTPKTISCALRNDAAPCDRSARAELQASKAENDFR